MNDKMIVKEEEPIQLVIDSNGNYISIPAEHIKLLWTSNNMTNGDTKESVHTVQKNMVFLLNEEIRSTLLKIIDEKIAIGQSDYVSKLSKNINGLQTNEENNFPRNIQALIFPKGVEEVKKRRTKENKKIYMLKNTTDTILKNTLIKQIYDILLEEGQCHIDTLVKFYEEQQKEKMIRRTDGTLYTGKGPSTIRGALEANRFFETVETQGKQKSQIWKIGDKNLANAFFREQRNTIKSHKEKYKLPLKGDKK